MTNQTATEIFNYIRGAIRGAYGVEDFRGKKIVIFGMGKMGQDLLTLFCFDSDIEIFFSDPSIVNYRAAHKICGSIQSLSEEDMGYADIVINLFEGELAVGRGSWFKVMSLSNIVGDPYTQGIQDFYL